MLTVVYMGNMQRRIYMKNRIKRITGCAVIMALLTLSIGMTAFGKPVARAEYDLCFVNTDGGNLNCRAYAGEEYAIVGKFANGTRLSWSVFGEPDSQGRDWTAVSGPDINGEHISGWVLDSYLRYERPSRSIQHNIVVNPLMPDVG